MKTICLVKNGKPLWDEIEKYLLAANARVVPVMEESAIDALDKVKPDLIITGDLMHMKLPAENQNTPTLVITKDGFNVRKGRNIQYVTLPVDRDGFLEATARMLYISERRVFKTVVSVTLKGSDDKFHGWSLNFSSSGMALKTDRHLKAGDLLDISFFIPNTEERVVLSAEVMRVSTNPEDGSAYYGVRFMQVDDDLKSRIEEFINKSR